jgi:CheY-like chemotaxis protein
VSQSDSVQGQRPSLLLVEPSRALRQALVTHCTKRGVDVTLADDVPGALAAVLSERPVAVLTSAELKGMGGLALVAALKACREHRALPAVVITSGEIPGAVVQPDLVLTKDPSMLNRLDDFLDEIGLGRESEIMGAPLAGTRILLAEDSAVGRAIIGRILHVAGAEVVTVSDGAEAVASALAEPFDLILLDIEMPRLDGVQVATVLEDAQVEVPMVAITSLEDADISLQDVGFAHILGKSTPHRELLAVCQRLLALA